MSKSRKIKPTSQEVLKNFNITINEFGEITSTTPVEKINTFLDQHLSDKKFKGHSGELRRSDEEE